jgi:kinesin family protein C2/C3
MYEAELERAHGQMLEEMQSLEEDKNRAIEEAFARAQVEMKAVHENLAGEPADWALPTQISASRPTGLMPCWPHAPCALSGVRTNLLTLQPALRTLTNDYNGLKRQVRGFPMLLQEALRNVKAEVSKDSTGWAAERPWEPPT